MTRACRVCGERYTGEKWLPMNDGTGRFKRCCCGLPNHTYQELYEDYQNEKKKVKELESKLKKIESVLAE